MKKLNKLLAIILAVAMIMSLAVTAYAFDITIENTEEGITYYAYKIFDATYDDSTESYSYTILSTSAFYDFIVEYTSGQTGGDNNTVYFTLTEDTTYTGFGTRYIVEPTADFNDTDAAATLAAAIYAAVDAGTLTLPNAAGTGTVKAGADSVTFSVGTEPGYYFVTTSLGSLTFLDSIGNSSITIKEKNGSPTVVKEVSDDGSDGSYGEDSDAEVGDTVFFKTTISNVYNVSNLVLHDLMEDGLDNVKITSVTFYKDASDTSGTELSEESSKQATDTSYYTYKDDSVYYLLGELTEFTTGVNYYTYDGSNYSTVAGTTPSSGTDYYTDGTFDIEFTLDFTSLNATENSYIVVLYTAELTSDAEVYTGTESNDNDTYLSYGNSSNTARKNTQTYTYPLAIYKFSTYNTETALAGVEFKIYYVDGTTKYYAVFDNGVLTGWTDDSTASGTTITTDSAGQILVEGLDGDTVYYLTETKALDGYNLLDDDIMFQIVGTNTEITGSPVQGTIYTSEDGTTWTATGETQTIGSADYNSINVENQQGKELPATGGIGTTIFYVVGGILVVGAIVLLITKKRLGNEDK